MKGMVLFAFGANLPLPQMPKGLLCNGGRLSMSAGVAKRLRVSLGSTRTLVKI